MATDHQTGLAHALLAIQNGSVPDHRAFSCPWNINSLAAFLPDAPQHYQQVAPAVLPAWRGAPRRCQETLDLSERLPADLPSPLGKYSESLREPTGCHRRRTCRLFWIRRAAVCSCPKDSL